MKKYKEYRLGDLFEVLSSKKIFHGNQINISKEQIKDSYPYVVRATTNNGIRGYVLTDKKHTNFKNTISFAQDTFTVFYQEKAYITGNKIKVLNPLIPFNKRIGLYITTSLNQTLKDLSWGIGSDVNFIQNIKLKLPITTRTVIDFDAISRGGVRKYEL